MLLKKNIQNATSTSNHTFPHSCHVSGCRDIKLKLEIALMPLKELTHNLIINRLNRLFQLPLSFYKIGSTIAPQNPKGPPCAHKSLFVNLPPTRSNPCSSMKQSSFLKGLLLGTQFFSFRFFNSGINDSPCTVLMTTCSAFCKFATLIELHCLTLSRDLVLGFLIRFLSSRMNLKQSAMIRVSLL